MSDAELRRANALAVLDLELARLDALIEREIARLRARYELSLDEFRGLYISDRQVDELVEARDRDAMRAHPAAADALPPRGARANDTPLARLVEAYALDDDAADIVVLALAPEVDPKYEVLFAYLNNDVTRKLPTAELAARLLGRSRDHRVALRGALAADAPLLANGLVEFAAGSRDLPRSQRGLRLAPVLVDWLHGLPWSDERLATVCRLDFAPPDEALDLLPPATAATVRTAARAVREGRRTPVFLCTAPTPGEAALTGAALFAASGRPALMLDMSALRASAAPAEALVAAELMQRVLGVGIVATSLDAAFDGESRNGDALAAALRRLCDRSPALALCGTAGAVWREAVGDNRTAELRARELATDDRARIWRNALAAGVPDVIVDAVADRFVLGADRIMRAAQAASDAAAYAGRDAPTPREIYDAARAASGEATSGVTRPVETPFDWDDLIVPLDVRARLMDLLRAVELRPRVLGQWGFGRTLGVARGIKVLFAGASGTGKTMAAGIMASTLGIELHRIDLAATVSKYIGETEKNLDRAFATARRANAILFIDEADALLGKRSEVKEAHDRYANVEIAYLLQRMEDHDGVVILATNLAQNIDEAFSRRMHFVIDFPLPDVAGREALWRAMFPATAPVDADLDFGFLARRFVLAGGDIRNIVLDAAYRAAQDDRAIGMRHLLRAVAHQFAKRGRVPASGEFREYAALLAPDVRDTVGEPVDAGVDVAQAGDDRWDGHERGRESVGARDR